MPRTRAADWDDSPGRRTVRQLIRMAEEDPDRVSIFSVGPDDRKETADLAVIVLFGRDELRLFRDWAERSGLLTPGADIPECSAQALMRPAGRGRRRASREEDAARLEQIIDYVRDAGDMFIEEDGYAPPGEQEARDADEDRLAHHARGAREMSKRLAEMEERAIKAEEKVDELTRLGRNRKHHNGDTNRI